MKIHAVIDTNIIVSAMLTANPLSPTRCILGKIRDNDVTPMINDDIIEEYTEVLSRSKFHFKQDDIDNMLDLVNTKGVRYTPTCLRQDFIDMNDVIFYETYLMRDGSYLVTGNLRHFPKEARIVSPNDMMDILRLSDINSDNLLNEPAHPYMSNRLQRAWEALERMQASAVANGISDMTMEEIDEEIRQYREQRTATKTRRFL